MSQPSFLRPLAFLAQLTRRALSSIFGSAHIAWSPPPWLPALARNWRRTAVILVLIATTAYGSVRTWKFHTDPTNRTTAANTTITPAEKIAPLLVAQAASPKAVPSATPAPTSNPDVRDTTKRAKRTLEASVQWAHPIWNEQTQKVSGSPLAIHFSGAAAPVGLVGKPALAGTVTVSPEVPGMWKWTSSETLTFELQGGWMPPRAYDFKLGADTFAPDCTVSWRSRYWHDWHAPLISASFGEKSFYVDPATPALQQTVATVTFSQPVSREEIVRQLRIVNMSETPLFAPGGKPQVVADEKNPLRFFLRSPLIKPGEKEDLIRFQISPGLRAMSGGDPTSEEIVTKITSPSRYSAFFFKEARAQLVADKEGESRQFIFLESSTAASGATIAKATLAWQLPPPKKNKDGEEEPWTPDNVTPDVLAKSKRVQLEFIPGENAPPTASVFGFRLAPQSPARLCVRIPK